MLDLELCTRLGLETRGERIAFPYRDAADPDKIVKVKLLHPRPGQGETKWMAEKGGEVCLFNAPVVTDPDGSPHGLVITEGEIDCITALMADHPHAVSLQNGAITSLDHEGMIQFTRLAAHLAKWKWFILALDNDEKGKATREVLLGYLGKGRCKVVEYPEGCKDLNDVLQKHGLAEVKSVIAKAEPYRLRGVFLYDEIPDPGPMKFYGTGLPALGDNFAAFRGGLVTIAGVASHGKSTVLNAVLGDWVCNHGLRVCMASLEMPVKPFLGDALSRYFYGRARNIRTSRELHNAGLANQWLKPLPDDAREVARQWLQKNFVFMDLSIGDDDDLPTIDWLLSSADDAMMRHGFDVLVVDPWNKIDIDANGENHFRAEIKALNRLKAFARQRNVIVIVVTHPSLSVRDRNGEARAPSMLDISGGGHWSAMSDHIVIVHRPDLTLQRVEVHVKKAKFYGSGKVGVYEMIYARGIEYFLPVPASQGDQAADLEALQQAPSFADDPLVAGYPN